MKADHTQRAPHIADMRPKNRACGKAGAALLTGLMRVLFGVEAMVSSAEMKPIDQGKISRPPGDADRTVRSEWKLAEESRNRDALLLFIARHPRHPLAEKARALLRRIEGGETTAPPH